MTQRSGYRRPQWMVIVTVGISLLNALVRVFKLFSARKKASPPPAAPRTSKPGRGVVTPSAPSPVGSDGGIPDLFRRQQSDQIVQASGTLVKILPDDIDTSDGSEQHQKFLVELLDSRRTTVKICHNLKFGRAPAKEGQVVSFRGEYEYNDKGGSVHWTHHDPMQIHPDGWIEIDGQRYG